MTYTHLTSWLTDARNLTNPSTTILLIGNKKDLEAQRDVTYEEAAQFAKENGASRSCAHSAARRALTRHSCRRPYLHRGERKNVRHSPVSPLRSVAELRVCSGENVEDAFLRTAKLVFQSVQDGTYVLCNPTREASAPPIPTTQGRNRI